MIKRDLLLEMKELLSEADADEMAIPSYLHPVAPLRWMALRRLAIVETEIKRFADRHPRGHEGLVALDYGCGTGVLFEPLSRHFSGVIGVDRTLDAAELLLRKLDLPKVTLIVPAAINDVQDCSVDLIVCAEVLEHIDDLDTTIGVLMGKLRPLGSIIVTLPTENLLYRLGRRVAGFSGDYHRENAAGIHKRLVGAGLERIRRRAIPFPGPLCVYVYGEYKIQEDHPRA